ncbi:alpha/beta hydrolase [Paenibacillus sp. MWE-103]|uniref:Alpha/beta hydrolase n=1 Tax=Paenibacillus artemisiicola TaxID=1172618 RepID=A0ABS3WA50_9BACL|nr:alpha/beta hydrolase [Paenibacillus artemisiicola]
MPFFRMGDVELHRHEPAGGGKDGTIVCVHPPCLTGRLFESVERELGNGLRTVRWDVRGHGRSSAGSARLTLAMIAEDMRHLLDDTGAKRAYVCAYGAGAPAALTALLLHPERFAGAVLLSGSLPYADIRSRSKLQAAYVSSLLAPKGPIAFRAAWHEGRTRAEFEELRQEASLGDPGKWRDYAAACLDGRLDRQIRQIKQPVLLLYGAKDAAGADHAARLHRLLPNSELYGIIGAKGQLATREPKTTAFVIRQWSDKQAHPEIADTHEEREQLLRELAEHGAKEPGRAGLVH